MSATAIHTNADRFEETGTACRILILHEDFSAYSRAVEVCRRMMEQFAGELDFDIKCWSFVELADWSCARHAAKNASAADILLLAPRTSEVPEELERWLDVCCVSRVKTDGVLALLLDDPDASPAALEKMLLRVNLLAGRLGVDFVPLLPGSEAAVTGLPVPGWQAKAPSREISDRPNSDHWGLNE